MIGQILSRRYQITHKLGKGSFGETYLAEDLLMANKCWCVVKHLKPQYQDPFTLERARNDFHKEAETLQKLGDHPQIPRLLAYFEENQQFYLVQEYIEGKDLSKELLPGKKISEQETIELLSNILEVLVFVQENQVIHRDLKPSNLMRRDADGKIVFIDFGAVKQISAQRNTTIAIGTPGYMPSEQFNNNPQLCSDIYAVGMIGIQALTGILPSQLPRDGNNEVLWKDLVKVKEPLASILTKMVKERCKERYQTAADVLQDLSTLTLSRFSKNPSFVKNLPQKKFFSAPLVSGVIVLGLSMIFVVGKHLIPRTKFIDYDNQKYHLKIKYPEKWSQQKVPDPVTGTLITFLSPLENSSDRFNESVTLRVESLPEPMSLNEYTNQSIDEIKEFLTDANIVSNRSITLANRPAQEVIYRGKDDEENIKQLEVWTLYDQKAYVITYTAEESKYNNFLPIIQEMINSFTIQDNF